MTSSSALSTRDASLEDVHRANSSKCRQHSRRKCRSYRSEVRRACCAPIVPNFVSLLRTVKFERTPACSVLQATRYQRLHTDDGERLGSACEASSEGLANFNERTRTGVDPCEPRPSRLIGTTRIVARVIFRLLVFVIIIVFLFCVFELELFILVLVELVFKRVRFRVRRSRNDEDEPLCDR